MGREEYRAVWFDRVGVTPPASGSRLSVRGATDERLAREGWVVRVAFAVAQGYRVAPEVRREAELTEPGMFRRYSEGE